GLLVMTRPGSAVLSAEQLRERLHLPERTPLRLEGIETPLIDISSRDLPRRFRPQFALFSAARSRVLHPREAAVQDPRLAANRSTGGTAVSAVPDRRDAGPTESWWDSRLGCPGPARRRSQQSLHAHLQLTAKRRGHCSAPPQTGYGILPGSRYRRESS